MSTEPEHDYMQARSDIAAIFDEAYELFEQRDAKYKGLWINGGAEDNAFHLRHKAMRVFRTLQDNLKDLPEGMRGEGTSVGEMLVEDAYDLINYAAFYIWCVQNGVYRCKED